MSIFFVLRVSRFKSAYFAEEMNLQVARLLGGREDDLQQWLKRARSLLETRMEEKIRICLDLAAQAIRDFPKNRYTRMLHVAPSEIIRMMQKTGPLSGVSIHK